MKKLSLIFIAAILIFVSCDFFTSTKNDNPSNPGSGGISSNNESENPTDDDELENGTDFESHSAKATYYDYTDTVATGITFVPSGIYKCAMHEDTMNEGYEGACIEITGPKGTIKALVIDCLPRTDSGVSKGDIDIMTSDTFSKIANVLDGRVDITWKMVELPTSGPIQYQMQGNNQWWIGIRPQNQKYPISKIEIKDGGEWKQMGKKTENHCYNYYYYQASGDALSTPIQIRVTSINGKVFEDSLSSFAANITVNGIKNF